MTEEMYRSILCTVLSIFSDGWLMWTPIRLYCVQSTQYPLCHTDTVTFPSRKTKIWLRSKDYSRLDIHDVTSAIEKALSRDALPRPLHDSTDQRVLNDL